MKKKKHACIKGEMADLDLPARFNYFISKSFFLSLSEAWNLVFPSPDYVHCNTVINDLALLTSYICLFKFETEIGVSVYCDVQSIKGDFHSFMAFYGLL